LDEELSVADSALRDPRVTRDELITAVDELPRTGRATARRVVELASDEAANPFESCVRAASLGVRGLHLVPQVQVDSVGWADLVDTRLRIVVECDSWAYHSGEDQFRQDVRRYTDMVRRDWLVVRFVWEDAMVRADRIQEVLTAVVRVREGQRANQAAYASKV
jgi:very-short-patch-repair endonuclease